MEQQKYIQINQEVGLTVSLGPIPAKQLPAIGLTFSGTIFFLNLFLGLSLFNCFLLAGWLTASWWVLTGNKRWRYTNRLTKTAPNWTRGFVSSESLLSEDSGRAEEAEEAEGERANTYPDIWFKAPN